MRRMIVIAVLIASATASVTADPADAATVQDPPDESQSDPNRASTSEPADTPPRSIEVGGLVNGGFAGVNGGSVEIGAHQNSGAPGESAGEGGPATPARSCVSTHWTTQTAVLTDPLASSLAIDARVEGRMYTRYCQVGPNRWESQGVYTYTPGGPGEVLAPVDVARQALAKITVPDPVPLTSPGVGVPQIVGLPTWLWVDPATWQPLSDSATVGGMTITATVTPTHITWDMGEGRGKDPVTCDGPGTPYDPDGPDSQRTDCSYTYQFVSDDQGGGVYHAHAIMVWEVSWSGGGATGTLTPIQRTTAFDLGVTERQAVVTYGG
jgi:hypothetical protein